MSTQIFHYSNTGISSGQRFYLKDEVSGIFLNRLNVNSDRSIQASNLVYNTGNQTISGVKTFINNQTFSGNINVSGTGIFNALDLNNIDNLSLSGVDINLTNGNVISNYPIIGSNLVYNTGNQTISGLKTFTSGVSVTGGSINLIGLHLTATNNAIGGSIVLQGGSGCATGGIGDYAYGGNISLIGGTAASGGVPGTLAGSIKLVGGSGAITNTLNIINGNDEFGSVSLKGGATSNDPQGGAIILRGNTYINPNNYARDFIIYKTGSSLPSANLTVSQNNIIATSPISAPNLVYNTGNQTISGIKTFISSINATGISGATIILTPNNTGNYFDQPRLVFTDAGILKSTGPKASLEYRSITLGVNVTDDSNGADLKKIYSGQNAPMVSLSAGPASYSQREGVTISNNKSTTSVNQYDYILFVDTNTGSNTYGGVKIGGLTNSNIAKNGTNPIDSGFLLDVAGNVKANSGVFNSGIDLNHSKLIDAVPELINVTSNFNIPNNYDGRMILANSSSDITGIIPSGNSTGFNASILQIGLGKISVTGSGLGVVINSFNNQFKTAGQFAAVSILHTGNNRYIMYGNTSAS